MKEICAYAPGRTELAGNHTDHQGGRVIAAAVDCGVEMVVRSNGSTRAHVESEGFAPVDIVLADGFAHERERFTTASLVRGVVAGLRAANVEIGGFDARVRSTVPAGGGLSSSAAFELALATALCGLFGACGPKGTVPFGPHAGNESNGSNLSGPCSAAGVNDVAHAVALARICQVAERDYFGKACGLMDQLAVALGGIAAIDLRDEEPHIERIDFDLAQQGHVLCLVNTHCDHSRYTEEYSQVARDMSAVAEALGARTLSQVAEEVFLERFEEMRSKLGDVAAMRALHYYYEIHLVDARAQALRAGDMKAFLHFTRLSGASSAQYLQNVSTYDRASQPAMVALALADRFLEGEGACRIHGGGFGGTIQAFVPIDRVAAFTRQLDAHLGEGSCRAYCIDPQGARLAAELGCLASE